MKHADADHFKSFKSKPAVSRVSKALLKCALETLDTHCYLLKCSWNVLLSLEMLETLDALETQTRLEINRRHHLPDLAVIYFAKCKLLAGELRKWQFCTKCHETSDQSLPKLHKDIGWAHLPTHEHQQQHILETLLCRGEAKAWNWFRL